MANNKKEKDLGNNNKVNQTIKKDDNTKTKSNTKKKTKSTTSKPKSTNSSTTKKTTSYKKNGSKSKSTNKSSTTKATTNTAITKTKTTPKKTSSKTNTKKTTSSNKTAGKSTNKKTTTTTKNIDYLTNTSKTQNKILNENIKIKSVEITEIPKIEQIQYIRVKKRKLNKKNFLLLILLCISILSLFYTLFSIIFWMIDNRNINNQIDNINNVTKVEIIDDNENTEIIEQENIKKSDPYWDYIKMNMIDVDFKELKSINNETKGWIQINETNVNYPFVQAKDNDYYLKHSFDKSYNGGGWVFLDYRNNIESEEKNTIIYGHGRQNKTIFGSLKNLLESEWINNKDNFIIKLSTEKENTLWQIFSIYRIPSTNDYIRVNFNNNEDFINFANMLLNRSQYNFNTTLNENDKILTLSTCYNDNDKVAIHAKLIKKELK